MIQETAKKTALSQSGVKAFASALDVQAAARALPEALDGAGPHVATILAFGLAVRGEKIDPNVVRALAPELDELDHLGVLLRAADADFVELVLTILGDDTISTTRSTYLVLLAADALEGKPAPAMLRTKARHLARHDLDVTPSCCIGAASLLLNDADLTLLAAPFIKESKRHKRVTDDLVSSSKLTPLDVLPEIAAPRVTARMTVRRGPEPGRNDVCPCGSGQKYKKCCALKPKDGAAVDDDRLDAATLRKDQVLALRPSELARLDFERLPPAALAVAPRRAARLGKWKVAERAIAAAGQRKELADDVEELRLETLSYALDAGAVDAAEAILAAIKQGKPEAEAPVELALIKKDPHALETLEAAMARALESEGDGAYMIDLAYAMLKHSPALGILVARGAIHERRVNDSMALMEEIEDARDRLLLPPFEAWWDVFDFMMKGAKKHASARKKDEGPDLKSELRRARAASRKASSEIDKLKKRLEEVDAQLAPAPVKKKTAAEPKRDAAPVDAALTEERRRLKNKVEELQRIIGEGQEERRELKKQLAEAAEKEPSAAEPEAEEPEEEDDDEGEGTEAPRGVLVPAFTDRAAKALADLDGPAADIVLGVIAGLAAGRENAWFGVKRLERARTVYSARAGIHYRVLFMIDDGVLRIHEIFHRRDLEAAINRMTKLSNPRS